MSKVQIIKEFSGGSMARTFLIKKNGRNLVRKSAPIGILGVDKLYNQWSWIMEFNKQYKGVFPTVSLFAFDKGQGYYDMEFIEMDTFRDLVLTQDIDLTMLHEILGRGQLIAEYVDIKDDGKKYFKEKHLDKMIERTKCVIGEPWRKDNFININGKQYTNLEWMIHDIQQDKELMELLRPKDWVRSHGDFTFQNILTDGETDLQFIDPRGEGPDSVYYDISKLYQSCHGMYDLLFEGNYEVNYKVDFNTLVNIDYKIHKGVEKFKRIFNVLRLLIPQYYDLPDDHWEIAVKFFEASHFISMTPFRMEENTEITLICYAKGIQIMNEALKEWKDVKSK